MVETSVYYNNNTQIPSYVRYSGLLGQSSVIRSSTDITGLGSSNKGMSHDDDNWAIGNNTADEIWYMSGHYSSTVLNSVSLPGVSGEIDSLSLDTNNIVCKCNFTGSISLVYYQGKVTSVILATFDPTNQSVYNGTVTPSCIFLENRFGVIKPVFYINVSFNIGGAVYLRLSSVFSTILEDIESVIQIRDLIPISMFCFDGDNTIMWSENNSTATVIRSLYFSPTIVGIDIVPRPAWVTVVGMGDIENDNLEARMITTYNEAITHEIELTDSVHLPVILTRFACNDLVFFHELKVFVETITHDLEITHEHSVAGGIYNRSFAHNVDFTDTVSVSIPVSADNMLTFGHSVSLDFQEEETHTLIFSDSAVESLVSRHEEVTLTFGHLTAIEKIVHTSADSTVTFDHVLAHYIEGVSLCDYDPQPPRTLAFPVETRATVTLQDNLGTPINIISIRNPGLGNSESLEIFRTVNISRSRNRSIFRDSDWPQNRVLNIVSSENTLAESITFLDFLSATLGEKIRLIDWENRSWIGIILNPDSAVKDLGGNVTCRFQFDIEFLGELTQTTTGDDVFEMSQSHNLFLSDIVEVIRICQGDCDTGIPITFQPASL